MTEQEFHILMSREWERLAALAARFLRASGMEGEAEDIVQDAVMKLWELSQKGYPIRDAKALAVRLTKNGLQHARPTELPDNIFQEIPVLNRNGNDIACLFFRSISQGSDIQIVL